MRDTPSHYVLSFCEVSLNLLQTFLSYFFDKVLTFDLTATVTLGVGTQIMCATHLLIMFYVSVKFHQIRFSGL